MTNIKSIIKYHKMISHPEGGYYVEVLNGGKIKLYESRGLIETNGSVVDGTVVNNARGFIADGTNNHSFVLSSQIDDSIHP